MYICMFFLQKIKLKNPFFPNVKPNIYKLIYILSMSEETTFLLRFFREQISKPKSQDRKYSAPFFVSLTSSNWFLKPWIPGSNRMHKKWNWWFQIMKLSILFPVHCMHIIKMGQGLIHLAITLTSTISSSPHQTTESLEPF